MSEADPDLLDRRKVKELREFLNLSQDQASSLAGLRKAQWSDIENSRTGGISLATLGKLAKALQCHPCDLLTPPPPQKPVKRSKRNAS